MFVCKAPGKFLFSFKMISAVPPILFETSYHLHDIISSLDFTVLCDRSTWTIWASCVHPGRPDFVLESPDEQVLISTFLNAVSKQLLTEVSFSSSATWWGCAAGTIISWVGFKSSGCGTCRRVWATSSGSRSWECTSDWTMSNAVRKLAPVSFLHPDPANSKLMSVQSRADWKSCRILHQW